MTVPSTTLRVHAPFLDGCVAIRNAQNSRKCVVDPRRAMPDWFFSTHSLQGLSFGLLGSNFQVSQGMSSRWASVYFSALGGQNARQGCTLTTSVVLMDRVVCALQTSQAGVPDERGIDNGSWEGRGALHASS
jgi:hypothetical protein